MTRIIIGAVPAAIAMLVVGFLFFATPLSKLATATLGNAEAAEVQSTLAANMPRTGTYFVPSGDTPEQTVMYGQGPIATVHYNTDGFPVSDMRAVMIGLVLNIIVALLMGWALTGIDRRVPDFPSRANVVIFFAVAASAFMHLSQPVWYHHGWGFFIYAFIADAVALSVGGLVLARWFLPPARSAPEDAPTDV